MIFRLILVLLFAFLAGCGYHSGRGSIASRYHTVTVPFVGGDSDGDLTAALVEEISRSGAFTYVCRGGEVTLEVVVVDLYDENIGFRYGRKEKGEREHSLVPTEARITIVAEVSLIDAASCESVLGPTRIFAHVDFDHTYYSTRDRVNVFSLGQLNDIYGAHDAVLRPLNRALAEKIVDYISAAW